MIPSSRSSLESGHDLGRNKGLVDADRQDELVLVPDHLLLDGVGLLEDRFGGDELVERQAVDLEGDLLVLDDLFVGPAADDQDGVPLGVVDDAGGFLGRPAPLLQRRVLVDFQVVPAALVDDFGRSERRRQDLELLGQDFALGASRSGRRGCRIRPTGGVSLRP